MYVIHHLAKITAATNGMISISLVQKSTWENAFGVKTLSISGVKLSISINVIQPVFAFSKYKLAILLGGLNNMTQAFAC